MRSLLELWDQYLDTVRGQLQCLERPEPDLARFQELARARTALAQEIDACGRPEDAAGADDAARAGGDLLRSRMEACGEADRAVLARLGELRKETAGALKRSEERAPACAGYLAGGRARVAEARRRVDVRS